MGEGDQNHHPKSYTTERCHCSAPAKAPFHPPCPPDPGSLAEMPYLEVADHGEASGADPAGGQPQGVEEGRPEVLQEVGVAQQPHQDDCRRETQPRRTPLHAVPHPCPPPGGECRGGTPLPAPLPGQPSLTHEGAQAADEAEEAALGRQGATLAAGTRQDPGSP